MAWRVSSSNGSLGDWSEGKTAAEKSAMLGNLAEFAASPLGLLPGVRVLGKGPMDRWAVVGPAVVFFRVYEPQGLIDLVDIVDL